MALEMKKWCETCNTHLANEWFAYICANECTYCEPCADGKHYICPKCDQELVRRPRKK